jgi:ribonucleoside-diphosphate reductase alpha chain
MIDIENMFKHQGKTTKVIGTPRTKTYKELYDHISSLQGNKLPFNGNYLGDNELAQTIYEKKYYLKNLNNETIESCPEDVFKRLASFIATVEDGKTKQKQWAEKFYTDLYEGRFVSGGRVLAGSGDLYRIKTLANCFVSKIQYDDIDSIYKAAFECARTYSYGGGIGVDISCLRPKDSLVHNAADSSTGAVSFMELYSLTTGLIGQSGRRGALMLTIDVKHPDVQHFIKVKKMPNWVTNQIVEQCGWSGLFDDQDLKTIKKQVMENTQVRFANISVKASDEFMKAIDEQREFGDTTLLAYQKNNKDRVMSAPQDEETIHYSTGIPSKNPKDYELLNTFKSFNQLKKWVKENYNHDLQKIDFEDASKRDIYGDFIVPINRGKFDIVLKVAGDFMLYFDSPNTNEIKNLIKARDIWDQFIEGNYKTAEPGLIFWSTMTNYSPSNYVGKPIICTNPCAEVPLEDGGACNLGSINLSRFVDNGFAANASIDWDQLAESTETLVRFLDNVVTWNEDLNALEKQRIAATETRRLGLGVMGIADMLNQLGVAYDSEQGIIMIEKVMEYITNAAYQASSFIAKEKSPSPIFDKKSYMECPFVKEALSEQTHSMIKKNGLRNIAIMSIAPTGSISNIVLGYKGETKNYIGVSGGVEPIFSVFYTRRSESFGNQLFKIFHSTVQAYIDKMGMQSDVDNAENVEDVLPEYLTRTAHKIDSIKRVNIQGVIQRYIDHSISSTINLPEDVSPERISDIYIKAWKNNLKGVTIYRDGSRSPILSVENEMTEYQEMKIKSYSVMQENGETIEISGDDIFKLPDGKLTTMYHHLRGMKSNDSDNEDRGVQEAVSVTEEIKA